MKKLVKIPEARSRWGMDVLSGARNAMAKKGACA
jgi:hypothetical protein